MSDYVCPKCGGEMDWFGEPLLHDVDDLHYQKGALFCEACNFEIPFEGYGFSSEEEFEKWFNERYEQVYYVDEDIDVCKEEEGDDEYLDIYTAQENWMGSGKDEDYTFGYSESDLESLK